MLGVGVLAAVFANQGGYQTPDTFVEGFVPALTIGAATVALGAAAARHSAPASGGDCHSAPERLGRRRGVGACR